MEASYQRLLKGNETFIAERLALDPDFFTRLSKQQKPEFLWVGCSDSRVPANEITNTDPGEIFVHRNIANVVVHTDLNFMSVLQYSVEVLKVKHIIVCGHYGCGGVLAAMSHSHLGLVNKWVRNIKEVYQKYVDELEAIADSDARAKRLVELNVIEQVHNLAKTSIVQKAWQERPLQIHGWVYGLDSGRIKDLECKIRRLEDLEPIFRYEF
ncbi:MAG: carbonic anhydrase [Saprospiraceae bacterium]|nr:carbonic anhydrase [Saprospiraceae bacterium]